METKKFQKISNDIRFPSNLFKLQKKINFGKKKLIFFFLIEKKNIKNLSWIIYPAYSLKNTSGMVTITQDRKFKKRHLEFPSF